VATTQTSIRHVPASGADARTLDRLVHSVESIDGVWSDNVQPGDWIVVRTRNSVYSLAALGKGQYRVVGGWFRSGGADGQEVRIAGCTWGGTTIHTRLVAAVGMYLEFDNGVRTTRIREVSLIRGDDGTAH
jgi:hypothetical protein